MCSSRPEFGRLPWWAAGWAAGWSALPLLSFGATAWADECDRLPPPAVSVKRLDDRVVTSSQYGYRALNNLGASLARSGQRILGLTRANAVVRFETRIRSYIDRSGRWQCASPQISVTYGFAPMTVYVANEFPEGSCAYKEIYAHELRHVKAYQAHVAGIEKELTESLARRFAAGGPWREPVGQTQERLQQEIDQRWIPYVKREIERVDEAQALIDTDAEYERVAAVCDGEIKRRLR